MISTQQTEDKQKSFEKQIAEYNTLKWHKSYRGIAALFLIGLFLLTAWSRFILALLLLPLIYFVFKGKKSAMVISQVYTVIVTIVLIAVYIETHRNGVGDFTSSLTPVYFYLIYSGVTLWQLHKAGKVEKLRKIA